MTKAKQHLLNILSHGPLPTKGILTANRHDRDFYQDELKKAARELKLDQWTEGTTEYWGLPGTKPTAKKSLLESAHRLGKKKGA